MGKGARVKGRGNVWRVGAVVDGTWCPWELLEVLERQARNEARRERRWAEAKKKKALRDSLAAKRKAQEMFPIQKPVFGSESPGRTEGSS
jgi:hypothetical protein